MTLAPTSPAGAPAVPTAATDVDTGPVATGEAPLGTLLLVAADAMLLVGLIAVFYASRALAFQWPPKGVAPGTYRPVVISLTVVMSAASVEWAAYAARRDDRRTSLVALALTIFLALSIFNIEWYDISSTKFAISRHTYGTLHYALLGYHLLNVLVGIAILGVALVRAIGGEFDRHDHDTVRAAAIFWQWTNVAWFLVFTVVWLVA